MAKTDTEIKFSIEHAIKAFSSGNLTENSLNLFQVLGYNTDRQQPLPDKTFACFKEYYLDSESRFNEEKALTKEWQQIDLLFQLTKEEVTGQNSLFDTAQVDRTIMEAYLFFCIEFNDREYTRTALSQITREINKVFKMPVMVLFKLGDKLSLAVINRRLHKKDAEKDVLEKVTLIKDINILKPHRAHMEILFDLTIEKLHRVHKFTNFVELHEAWKKTLDTKELNKRFYKDLSNWYFWAIKEVYFPGAPFQATLGANAATDPQVREHNAKNLIRLLTRLLFVWFVKEKNLVPDQLFDERFIKEKLLTGFDPAKTGMFDDHTKASRYYRAVLQNLFFASLNQVVGKRKFRKQGQHMNVTNLMRYESYFKDPQAFVTLVDNVVPFMNGGLFECLDKPDPQKKGKQGGDVIIYEDGFSDRADNTLCVPDYIFFSDSEHADLSSELDDKKQSNVTVRGLINILKDYKFTVTENTPIEEDIALDPELLGRVFENLLASYNPETKTTARKQTGSFYTPREIVDYMVDESLKAYLKQELVSGSGMNEEDADIGLNILFSYTEKEHAFNHGEKQILIEAIDDCKVLDPACGSGAFPMGILHKLVFILHKLDPDNVLWREQQRQNAIKETEDAFRIGNQEERENRLKDISDVFENNAGDFGRKLYLIENCIYGVDIQPIATQISKLRFFISLIVDQQSNTDKAHNYGVIPLPNLETKFVAANTLIAIEKPKRGDFTGGLFDDSRIDVLEKELQSVRHRLFSAKTPPTKRKLREDDKRLREQMGELLIMNGWGNETAHQMAAWDPYDQNASSPFFDMEWMFGIENGFDVVIGNPPYVLISKNLFISLYEKFYCLQEGKIDLYRIFIENAFLLLNNKGIVSFITPNTFLTIPSAAKIRQYISLQTTVISIVNYDHTVFESASVNNVVFVINKIAPCKNSCYKVIDLIKSRDFVDCNCYTINQGITSINKKNEFNIFMNESAESFINKLYKSSVILSEIADVFITLGLQPYHNSIHTQEEIKNSFLHSNAPLNSDYIAELGGRNVGKYSVDIEYKRYLNFASHMYWKPDLSYFMGERIVIREIVSKTLIVGYTADLVLFNKSCYVVKSANKDISNVFLLALLNSSVIGFFVKNTGDKSKQILFPRITMRTLKSLPIPTASNANKSIINAIEHLATELISIKKMDKHIDTIREEKDIDQLVYQLYELTPEEIAIIEK